MICYGLILFMYCQVPEVKAPFSNYCQITRPIYWEKSDTRLTKEQINIHNRKWKAVCK